MDNEKVDGYDKHAQTCEHHLGNPQKRQRQPNRQIWRHGQAAQVVPKASAANEHFVKDGQL